MAHYITIEISVPNSIICISFQTEDLDIQVGLYRASSMSRFEIVKKADENDEVTHPVTGITPLQEIRPVYQVDASKPTKINYVAEVTGAYRLVFSNDHSWYNSKILMYRYCVLRPLAGSASKSQTHQDKPT